MRKALSVGGALAVVAAVAVVGAFVVRSAFSTDAAPVGPAATPNAAETTNEPSPTGTARDVLDIQGDSFEPGTYYIDLDKDPSTIENPSGL